MVAAQDTFVRAVTAIGRASRAMRAPSAAAVLALLAWLALALVAASPASAHAVLLGSEPGDGQQLDAAPDAVVLRFSEPVQISQQAVRVYDAGGLRVDLADVGYGADATQVRVGLPGDLGQGVFTVTWRAVSADAHPIRGAFTFTVGDPGDVEPVPLGDLAGGGTEWAWEVPAAVSRFLAYAGVLIAVGGSVFLLVVHDRREGEARALSRVVTYSALVAVVATALGVVLHAVLASGLGWRALVSGEALGSALGSGVGLAGLVRVAGLGLLVAGLPRIWTVPGDTLVAVGSLASLTSYLLAGHTALSEPRLVVLAANLVHTGAAAVWFGGLVLLALVLRRRAGAFPKGGDTPTRGAAEAGPAPAGGPVSAEAGTGGPAAAAPRGRTALAEVGEEAAGEAVSGAQVVGRFSTVALVSLALLAAGGLALAWVEVRSLEALVTTTYGLTLLVKVGAAGIVVGLAAYNRTKLVPQVAAAGRHAWRRLSRTVTAEVTGLAIVLAITAVLVSLVPARTAAGIGEPYVDYLPLGGEHQVNLVVDPARTGRNEIHLYLLDGAGQLAVIGEAVTLRLSLPEAGIAPIEREPFAAGPGHWLYLGSDMAIPGTWRVEVRVLVSEFERLTATTDVRIGGRAR